MKKFQTNKKNDQGHEAVFINPSLVDSVEETASISLSKIVMCSGKEHIVEGTVDQVAFRLFP